MCEFIGKDWTEEFKNNPFEHVYDYLQYYTYWYHMRQLHAPGTVPKTLLRLPLLLVLPPPCCSGTWHPGSRWRPFVQFHCSICCDQCCMPSPIDEPPSVDLTADIKPLCNHSH